MESFAYSYDKNDNILSETRISNLPAEDKVINETRDYIYDAYGRLTQSTITDHTVEDAETVTTYEYDAVGNRTKQTRAGVETTYSYNGLNQLTHMETPTEEVEYNYDSRGNQIEEKNTTTEEITETTYNVAGEMVQLVKKNGETTVFTQTNVYNQEGSRISRTQGEIEKEYYYHNGVVSFTEDNNVLSASNLQDETGSVFGTYRGEDYYNYLKNLQGSTMSITGENGQATAVYTYSDFGETEEVVADSVGNEICYTGAVYDKDTGLYYMNARYYDAVTGRFISQDSYRGEIEDAGTWHLYAYCSNNPVNYVDPSGHKAKSILSIYYSYDGGTGALKKQAKKSPYYENSSVKFIGVRTVKYFKTVWNNIDSTIKTVYIYLHGYEQYLTFDGPDLSYWSLMSLKKKDTIKKVVLLSCQGAKGKNSVAKAFHNRTGGKATIYASKVKVSFRYEIKLKKYFPRYSRKYCLFYGRDYAYKNPIKKCYFK